MRPAWWERGVRFSCVTGDKDGDVLSHGVAKTWRKGADLLAVNAVGPALGFGDVPNAVVVLDAQGREVARASGSKDDVDARRGEILHVEIGPTSPDSTF